MLEKNLGVWYNNYVCKYSHYFTALIIIVYYGLLFERSADMSADGSCISISDIQIVIEYTEERIPQIRTAF